MAGEIADLAAFIGAAAWLPQIVQWVYRLSLRPKVQIVCGQTVDIQFDDEGPGVDLTFALIASRRSCTAKNITARLRHGNGRTMTLEWSQLTEPIVHMWGLGQATGQAGVLARSQPAIALRLEEGTTVERGVTFQDRTLRKSLSRSNQALMELGRVATETGRQPVEHVRASNEFLALRDLFKHAFAWEVGEYELEVRVSLFEGGAAKSRWRFALSESDVELIRRNLSALDTVLGKRLDGEAQDPDWPEVSCELIEL